MQDSLLWFKTGFEHITDTGGYDHILFVSLLALSFPINEWKKLLVLVTAFTLGHSLSLALSINGTLRAPRLAVEFCIALSILLTALYQLYIIRKKINVSSSLLYSSVTFFGLVHGLGFSYLLKSMLGRETSIAKPLLMFNLGLEAGQLLIVALVVLFSLFLTGLLKTPYLLFKIICVCTIALTALKLCADRLLLLL